MAKNPTAAPRKRGRPKKATQTTALTEPMFPAQVDAIEEGIIQIPAEPVVEDETVTVNPETGSVEIEHDDGSITIDPTGATLMTEGEVDTSDFGANLAEAIDPLELSRIANELLDAIESDKQDRSQWEQMRAKCIELLGLKLEDPKGDVSRSSLGLATSVVRDPVLLEAVERFRANAYAELCPAAGPVKVINFSPDKTQTEPLARSLEKDLNFYLTTTASEYYPDTRYMLWWTGLASGTFKKVYKCPLRRRPVSEYVDGTDLIVPSSATDLKNAPRITHQVTMPRNIMRAMQLEGVYRNVLLGEPMQTKINPVEAKVASVDGKNPQSQRIEDQEYTVYEVYATLDIRGFEHQIDGEKTGLPLPYRITIEETSREVLEIRRNWDIQDDEEVFRPAKIPFVLFPYSTGISRIYGSGLGQMMGNMASALTALLRISIDNGMMSNYPGLLKAKSDGRQLQNEIMVPPGGVAEIDTGGLPIQQFVMGMPFKDVSANTVAFIEQLRGVAQRLGGTAELPVGEGKQDAPVGTTLAMIEQATKVEGSVHKALHAAQSEEFRLLVELFKDDPEALWRGNRRPAMGGNPAERLAKFREALDNCDIVPQADPNVPSDMHRNLMAMGLKQFTAGNPAYNPIEVDRWVAKQMFKMSDGDFQSFLAPPVMPQPDPLLLKQVELEERKVGVQEQKVGIDAQKLQIEAMKAEQDAANKAADREARIDMETLKVAASAATAKMAQDAPQVIEAEPGVDPIAAAKLVLDKRKIDLKEDELAFKNANAQLDRQSKETIATLNLAESLAVHPASDTLVDEQLNQMSAFLTPSKEPAARPGGMSEGGRVGDQSARGERSSRPESPRFSIRMPDRDPEPPSLRPALDIEGDAIERALAVARQIEAEEFHRFLHS